MISAVIATDALTKRYGDLTVVDGIDLRVDAGDLFGFLGPNGSGKSTSLRMILGLVFATRGEIEVFGEPMPRRASSVLPSVGAVVEGPGFYGHLSGARNLTVIDASRRQGRRGERRRLVHDVLDRVGLGQVGNRPVRAYSSGMKQRLAIAGAIIRRPRLLVLDEPLNGLDPRGAHDIREMLVELTGSGTTVVFSTHVLSEVEQICNRAAIMQQGHLIAQDRIETLLAPTGRVLLDTPDEALAAATVREIDGVRLEERQGDRLAVHLDGTRPEELNRILVDRRVRVRELLVERRRLEDLYLDLTLGDAGAHTDSRAKGGGDAAG